MNTIPWQGLPNLANIRQQEMRAEAASWRTWRELRRARREAKRKQRAAVRSSRMTARTPAATEAATVTPLSAGNAP
jgi:hypothetical protein